MNMQKLILLGRATKDAELFDGKNGKPFAAFSIAVNRYLGKDQGEETTFYDCLLFGAKSTENAAEKIKKGDLLVLEGRPDSEAYLSKEGEPRSRMKVIVEDWQALK